MSERIGLGRNARDRALKVLVACYDGRRIGSELLHEWQAIEPLPTLEADLAAELVMGVARHRITSEHLAARFYRGRWLSVRPAIRTIFSMAIHQLCWLDRIPDHAAVDQAVRQAKRHGQAAAATVNAILRQIVKCRGDVMPLPDEPHPRRWLPLDVNRGRLFSEDVFPDPARKPLDYLVAAFGHPPFLVERWHRRFKPKLCRQVCEAGQQRPPLVLRPNPLRATPTELLARLAADGVDAQLDEKGRAVILAESRGVATLTAFQEGLCQPQDATSQAALLHAPPRAGEFVLDLCAGRGTKSTQAAELMGNDGVVLATDIDEKKCLLIAENADRLGVAIIRTAPIDHLQAAINSIGRPPDLILIDAPCTNSGVFARRPEARHRATFKALTALTQTQGRLLRQAAALAGPRTRIIYTTCSIEREENEEQTAQFQRECAGWMMVSESLTLPGPGRGGGYAALLTRE